MTAMDTRNPALSKTRKIPVVVIDDHPLLRRGVAHLINGDSALEVVGETGSAAEAYTLINNLKPQLAIVDISLDGTDGVELIKGISYRWPSLKLLAYSVHDERVYAERTLRAGAKGYLMKDEGPDALLQAIGQVLRGKVYLSQEMSDRLLGKMVGANPGDPGAAIDHLSDRELEVLQLIGRGMKTSQIAEKLCLSVKTIETYREHLKRKLNLRNGAELMRYAIEWSLSQN